MLGFLSERSCIFADIFEVEEGDAERETESNMGFLS